MNLEPMGDRLILRPVEEKQEKIGSLYVPAQAQDKQATKGEVLAVGPGRTTDQGVQIPMSLTPGQRVLFSKFAGSKIELDGEELLVVRESDIIAVLA